MQGAKEIGDYYEALAPLYDQDRFGNSYGRFIHRQELLILEELLGRLEKNEQRLDLGCGTGRLLDFGSHGLDYSAAMIAEAQKKYPNKELAVGSALNLPYPSGKFSGVYAFHLLMHLAAEDLAKVITEVYEVLPSGGIFLFDIPSTKRRQLTRYRATGWHAAQSLSIAELASICGDQWKMVTFRGVLFLPIHRFPSWLRPPLRWLDSLLCRSPWREYASYLVVKIQKQ